METMNPVPSLEALGLTRLEALAYAWLAVNPATTGYQVSKAIGKPTANVYRALEGLERKGAVARDRGSPPLFHAVPPDELFDLMEREFLDRREIAARALASQAPSAAADEDGIFVLANHEQVVGRLSVMLAAARHRVLLDTPAAVLTEIGEKLDDSSGRGVGLFTLVRGARGSERPDEIIDPERTATPAVRMVVDTREALMAPVAPGRSRVEGAFWTRGPLLVRAMHNAIAHEMFFVEVQKGLREGLSVDELEGAFERCRALRQPG